MSTTARYALPLLVALASGSAAHAGVADLADLGFAPSAALDIDAAGRIVGVRADEDGFRAVLWQDGGLTPLHDEALTSAWRPRLTPDGPITLTGTLTGGLLERALLIEAGVVIPLADPGSRALAPMTSSSAVGAITTTRSTTAAIFSPDHSPTPIILTDPTVTESAAIDANHTGDILISSRDAFGDASTWLVDSEGGSTRIGHGLEPGAINDRRAIVARRADTSTPVLITSTGSILDLPTITGSFGSTANDISNTGVVVGDALKFDETGLPTTRAWAWSEAAGLLDLTSLAPAGWALLTADAVNESGQIVGRAEHQGVVTGYSITLVPAPATIVFAPLMFLMSRRR